MNKKVYINVAAGAAVLIVILALIFSSKPKKNVSREPVFSKPLKEAGEAFEAGKIIDARELYKKAMESVEDANKLKKIQKKIEEINMKVIFSPLRDGCSAEYTVKPKDVLIKIARKYNTTVGLIKRANNLKSDMIRPRQKLKVSTCEFSIVVDKSQNLLFLKRKGEVLKTYVVSTGKDNTTPVGTFKIDGNKLRNPTWHRAGAIIPPDSPDNILGSRWMGLKGTDNNGVDIRGYGIHGTTEPRKLGKQLTLGCIRMKNEEVDELFDIVPSGTKVTIVD